jgi:hypothetical protein
MEDRPTHDAWAQPPQEPPVPAPLPVIPWEDPSRPWTSAFMETIGAFLTHPRQAFERVPAKGDALRPLVFAILVGWIGQFFYAVYEVTFGEALGEAMRAMLPGQAMTGAEAVPRGYWFAMMALAPLLTGISLVLSSCIAHLFLLLFGGARNGFTATFRALCYVQVVTLSFVLPFCGAFVVAIAGVGFEIIGFSALHRISIGKSAAAVLVPSFLCCACLLVMIALASAAIMSTLGGLTP